MPTIEELQKAIEQDKGRHEIVEHGGMRFEVREPTTGAKASFVDSLQTQKGKPEKTAAQITEANMLLVSRCVYCPDSGVRIYSDEDSPKLQSGRKLVEQFGNLVRKFMEEAKGDAGKELEETDSTGSGSSSENSLG